MFKTKPSLNLTTSVAFSGLINRIKVHTTANRAWKPLLAKFDFSSGLSAKSGNLTKRPAWRPAWFWKDNKVNCITLYSKTHTKDIRCHFYENSNVSKHFLCNDPWYNYIYLFIYLLLYTLLWFRTPLGRFSQWSLYRKVSSIYISGCFCSLPSLFTVIHPFQGVFTIGNKGTIVSARHLLCTVKRKTPVDPEQSRLRLRLIWQKSKLRLLSSVRPEE